MGDPYVGEVRMFAGTFAPSGWAFCNGQLLAISENDVLYQLIGTTYGGDGISTFALPNMQGRVPLHNGSGYTVGEAGGTEAVALTVNEIPAHSHAAGVSSKYGSTNSPDGTMPARSTLNQFTDTVGTLASMNSNVGSSGGGQPHSNMQPYLAVNFIICTSGITASEGGSLDSYVEPFVSEIRWVAFSFAPGGWALCNGQVLTINQNAALFSLIGTTYGGNGTTNFALPDLRGKIPIHCKGSEHPMGQTGGEQSHILSLNELPAHSHSLSASKDAATAKSPYNQTFAVTTTSSYGYVADSQSSSLATASVGGSQAHTNMQPYLCLNAIIATQGFFPSRP
jgi:microcystin-dependent protein